MEGGNAEVILSWCLKAYKSCAHGTSEVSNNHVLDKFYSLSLVSQGYHTNPVPALVPWAIPVWLQELQWSLAAHSNWLQHPAPLPEPFPEATQAVKAPSTMSWPLELGRTPQSCKAPVQFLQLHQCRHWPAAECLQQAGKLWQGPDTALLLLKDEFSSLRRQGWASGILLWEVLKISRQCSAHPSICASSYRLTQPASVRTQRQREASRAFISLHCI